MNSTLRKAALAAGSLALLAPASWAATLDVGWDAADLADGAHTQWDASPNFVSPTVVRWNGTINKTSGSTNFANVNDWVTTPDYNLTGGGQDSWQDAGIPTANNVSWEMVFRPGDFTGNHHLFNTGGNGSGTAFVIEGSTLRFLFQSANDPTRRIDISADLSSLTYGSGSASDFYHIAAIADVQSAATGTGQLWVNSVSAATATSTGNIADWDGGDLASLGSGNENHNIPTTTTYASSAFTGDIAIFNFYSGELLDQNDVNAAYNALIPEPSTSLLALIAGGLVLLRRRR